MLKIPGKKRVLSREYALCMKEWLSAYWVYHGQRMGEDAHGCTWIVVPLRVCGSR